MSTTRPEESAIASVSPCSSTAVQTTATPAPLARFAREREIRIWLDPVRLAGYALAIADVASPLRQENGTKTNATITIAGTEPSQSKLACANPYL